MTSHITQPPSAVGLYDPRFEHDACGVGLVAKLDAIPTHDVITKAISALENLEHRGASGADQSTGDGAGILMQMPHELLRGVVEFALPPQGAYGVLMCFLPRDEDKRASIEARIAQTIAEEGLHLLGVRQVPVLPEHAGEVANASRPHISQVFVGALPPAPSRPHQAASHQAASQQAASQQPASHQAIPTQASPAQASPAQAISAQTEPAGSSLPPSFDQDAFERKLYVVRRVLERACEADGLYIASSSSKTINYKGMLISWQLNSFYPDLSDPRCKSAVALVHSRFSTNTFPSWQLAHPYRVTCHNGEINTLMGNINWMRARESQLQSELFGDDLQKILPVVKQGNSDSATLDNVLELLMLAGRSLPHAVMMMIPEAYRNRDDLSPELKGFYAYHSCLVEPWDGPAAVAFTDGKVAGATLDRNGLRPGRWVLTRDGYVVLGSETGLIDVPPQDIVRFGRLQPGKLFFVDLEQGKIVEDADIKRQVATQKPYREWFERSSVHFSQLPPSDLVTLSDQDLHTRQRAFGYTQEDLRVLLTPMARDAAEPIGSMGNDLSLAVLSDQAPALFSYFKQLFAQVTNPPIDPIREEIVMSLATTLGSELNLLHETPQHAHQLVLDRPILLNRELETLRHVAHQVFAARTIDITFRHPQAARTTRERDGAAAIARDGEAAITQDGEAAPQQRRRARDAQETPSEAPSNGACLETELSRICAEADQAIAEGVNIIVLSDRLVRHDRVPIPSLLAVSAVHHHLVRQGTRLRAGIILESGEPREVHHLAALIGYGASAVNPYLMLETLDELVFQGKIVAKDGTLLSPVEAAQNVVKALGKGLLKTISKMGISTIQSYCGAQIFEAVGLTRQLVEKHFTGTASRIGGVGIDVLATEAIERHARAYPQPYDDLLPVGGIYAWRRDGEHHMWNPETIALLQHATRAPNDQVPAALAGDAQAMLTVRGSAAFATYKEYAHAVNEDAARKATLRGLLDFATDGLQPIPLQEVEPATAIVRRFCTGAMSLGSLSREVHETLAIAMNRLGGRSNTGEGGEDPSRFVPDANGDRRRSAIKQVASGRFGVTIHYLVNSDELQIKMAQGAKPGEGGQLPGYKVDRYIGSIRHTTPGVGLISPPPHHDIYSIEDLKQLIYDLRCANPQAQVSVKLVSEVGVGTVAAGVSKANADRVLISGHDGGTGASPLSSIQAAGVPWEIGLAETQQTLLLNNLRSRIIVQTDGQLKTGRDVLIAAMLGADEMGFSTAPLITTGCIMMRACHLNTCPVGIATQDPVLRARFTGAPEHVVNFFFFIAEEVRELLAALRLRKLDEATGRVDLLRTGAAIAHWKASGVDLTHILTNIELQSADGTPAPRRRVQSPPQVLDDAIDWQLVKQAQPALDHGQPVELQVPIRNVNRCVGGILSSHIARKHGAQGLPPDSIKVAMQGSAGQSFGGWLAPGVTFDLQGDANDYVGKGLSGGVLVVRPRAGMSEDFRAEQNVIIGNTVLYGATSGKAFFRGLAGERFAVRNSGATAVVEGIGDHGCEYMTGGRVVVLGETGRNFAAGMSGGIAYVLDERGVFLSRCNMGMVGLEALSEADIIELRAIIVEHQQRTGSSVAANVLSRWETLLERGAFVKVMPHDYKRVLAERAEEERIVAAAAGNGGGDGGSSASSNGGGDGGVSSGASSNRGTAGGVAEVSPRPRAREATSADGSASTQERS